MPKKTLFSPDALGSVPWLVLGKAVSFVIYFIISILVVKCLDTEQYGVFVMSKSLGSYLVIFCALGLNTCLVRYIPELVVRGEYKSIKNLISRSLQLQMIVLLVCGAIFFFCQDLLKEYFSSTMFIVVIMALWMGAVLCKNLLNDCLTALFKSRQVALISIVQAVIWLVLLYFASLNKCTIEMIFGVELISNIVVSIGALIYLRKYISGQPRSTEPELGIVRSRMMKLAAPVFCNGLLRTLMLQYTEIFFLGLFFTPALAGFYELGFSLPLLVITFIPMAVQTLFSSAFAEAYTRDKSLLGEMVQGVYKMLVLLALPLSCMGFMYSELLIVKIYGESMQPAGPVAKYFSLIHLFPLISIPLSMAVTTLEKNSKTLWLLFMQVSVNILLDLWLIPAYGLSGAILAIAATFVLTIPIRLYVIYKLIGGIWFPFRFFMKYAMMCMGIMYVVSQLIVLETIVDVVMSGALFSLLLLMCSYFLGFISDEMKSLILKRINKRKTAAQQ